MLLKGMLKWAIAKDDRRNSSTSTTNNNTGHGISLGLCTSNSTKSLLRKRRKLSHSLVRDGGEVELITGCKNRNQSGCYLKQQHHHQRWNNGKPTHCRSHDNNNTCNDHSANTASHNIHNDNNNSIINSSLTHPYSNHNSSSNADSKSLLYMSLDHLPLAIVKQYERMLQEQEETEDNNNNDGGEDEPEKIYINGIGGPKGGGGGGSRGRGVGNTKNKKSLSFGASSRFKSSQKNKMLLLPLHGTSAGTSKSLHNVSKVVKQTKPVTSESSSIESPTTITTTSTSHGGDSTKLGASHEKSLTIGATTTTASPSSPSTGGTEMIRHAHSRSLRTSSFKTKPNDDKNEKTKLITLSCSPKNCRNRKISTTNNPDKQPQNEGKEQEERRKNGHNSSEKLNNKKLPPLLLPPSSEKSSTLPRAKTTQTMCKSILKNSNVDKSFHYHSTIVKNNEQYQQHHFELNNNNFTTANQNSIENIEMVSPIRRPFQSLLNVSMQCNPPTPEKLVEKDLPSTPTTTTTLTTPDHSTSHDTTDPQFLEKSLTFSFPAVARCAKKLTLKRSELKKLERIRSQTDRLNRFLRKYYVECLPNLPEEEDSQCSPEEKSVSILRSNWTASQRDQGDEEEDVEEEKKNKNKFSNSSVLVDSNQGSLLLFHSTTTSSSSLSSSCSSSSTCSSSSSSDLEWRGSYGHPHSHDENGHNSSSSRKSRQKRPSRSMLNNNETTLLPIIQEDSAEVSSASVKSLESRIPSVCEQQQVQQQEGQGRHNHNGPSSSYSSSSSCSSSSSASPLVPSPSPPAVVDGYKTLREGGEGCLEGDNLLWNDDSLAVKRDNMGDVEDHSKDIYLRNAFVTEGAETDFGKLKGSFMLDEKPFDPPPTPTLPFSLRGEESLRNPQLRFTPPHPSPSSTTTVSLFHENYLIDNHSDASSSAATSISSQSHGYSSCPSLTEKSNGIILSPQTHLHDHLHLQKETKEEVENGMKLKERNFLKHGIENGVELVQEIFTEDMNSFKGTRTSSTTTTNANYPSETENETWNSHDYSGSPCESSSSPEDEQEQGKIEMDDETRGEDEPQLFSSHLILINKEKESKRNDMAHFDHQTHASSPLSPVSVSVAVQEERHGNTMTTMMTPTTTKIKRRMKGNARLDKDEDESLTQSGRGLVYTPTPIRRLIKTPMKKSTPRKLVKKPPVKSIFSGKEVFIRTYINGRHGDGDGNITRYLTLHVVHAKNLQPSYRSSWKMAIKISLLPEAEATFTKSESVEVARNSSHVKIDQKFSFEISKSPTTDQKIFLTFWKRLDKKTSFLGWTSLNISSLNSVSSIKSSQSWFKLRKRKMTSSAASYTPSAYNSCKMNGTTITTNNKIAPTPTPRTSKPQPSPLPQEIETLEEIQSPEQDEDHNHFHHHHHPDEIKSSQFPNSSTMDSGVEDCCEQPILQPSIDLDETQGKRIHVKMMKQETTGFGFSVVWVSPPRIERLEKGKTADVAGLRIGDLIIGVNGEDVTTVPNTTIYHNMKTTGNELELEIWRKNSPPSVTPPPPPPVTSIGKGSPQIGSMVMMLMTGQGTGHKIPPSPTPTTPPPTVPTTVVTNQHQHIVNSHSATPSPRKQPPVQSQTPPMPTTVTGTVMASNGGTTNYNGNCTSTNSIQQSTPGHGQHHHTNTNTISHATTTVANSNNVPINANSPIIISSSSNNNNNPPIRVQLPPSILKPPPPVPPTNNNSTQQHSSPLMGTSHNIIQRNVGPTKRLPQHPQPTLTSSSWKIRFNVELLDNEEDSLKQFFICELKFFRKVVAALDRYLIPAQTNSLLTPTEIHSMFAHIITIITMTKRILQCVANGASKTGWRLGEILFSTHSDHLTEITTAYTTYAKSLGNSATILGEKIKLQDFARFVLETPVPKGHLDMTALLFAPLEHLRNLCEICDEIVHHFDHWTDLGAHLKECYANIIVHTDYMEPISHISMKKNPLLSVRDLEKRIVSTTCQPLKVNEKGRKWLFGSRLHRKEADGSWAPVWAFLFTDIIVLTSHTTRDRVFFVKENPIRLEDVVTLHFNLPRKNENEFRLLFGPEPITGRFDGKKWLPIYRRPKSNQVILRTPNLHLKSIWKLLLQRQIITLNTRLSKSSSSNFSISEFCEKFPDTSEQGGRTRQEKIDEEPEEENEVMTGSNGTNSTVTIVTTGESTPMIDRKDLSSEHSKDSIKSLGGGGAKDRSKVGVYASLKSIKEFHPPGKIIEEELERDNSIIDSPNKRKLNDNSQPSSSKSLPPDTPRPQPRIVQVPDLVDKAQVSKVIGTPERIKVNISVETTNATLQNHDDFNSNKTVGVTSPTLTTKIKPMSNGVINSTRLDDKNNSNRKPSLPLDLTSKESTLETNNNQKESIVRLTDTLTTRNDKDKTISNVKLIQKPVEMLVSPSEGSPLKSYLNRRNSTPPTTTESGGGGGKINNNNESIHDFNNQKIGGENETKCDCEVGEDQKKGFQSPSIHQQQQQGKNMSMGSNNKEWLSKSNQNSSFSSVNSEIMEVGRHREDIVSCDNKCSNKDSTNDAANVNDPKMTTPAKNMLTRVGEGSKPLGNVRTNGIGEKGEKVIPDPSSTTNKILMKGEMPGPKIMTNAILKNRQQELMASVTAAALSAASSGVEKIGTCTGLISSKITPLTTTKIGNYLAEKEPLVKSMTSQVQETIKSSTTTIKNVIAPSKYEQQRCHLENCGESSSSHNTGSNSCAKGTVVSNSPIVSGIGSDRSRRRLYDYKVRRDYPELFGITPRDRRSFIKMLGDKGMDNETPLVTPYYYDTRLSPLPQLRQGTKNGQTTTPTTSPPSSETLTLSGVDKRDKFITSPMIKTSSPPSRVTNGPVSPSPPPTTLSNDKELSGIGKNCRNRLQHIRSLDDDEDDASTSTAGSMSNMNNRQTINTTTNMTTMGSNKPSRIVHGRRERDEEDEEDSDNSTGVDRVRDLIERVDGGGGHHHRRRSPEESSSNDSGISEEILVMTDNQQVKMISSSTTEGSEDMNMSTSDSEALKHPSPSSTEVILNSSINLTKCAAATSTLPPCSTNTILSSTLSPSNDNNFGNNYSHTKSKAESTWKSDQSSCTLSSPLSSINTNHAISNACKINNNNSMSSSTTPVPSKIQTNSQVKSQEIVPPPSLSTSSASLALNNSQCDHSVSQNDNINNDPPSTHTNTSSPPHVNSKNVSFLQGETETTNSMEGMVELTKADKATTTEDDDYMDFTWLSRLPEKSYRSLMAERREAFFLTSNNPHMEIGSPQHHRHSHSPYYQNRFNSNSSTITTLTSSSQASSYSSSHHNSNLYPKEPLIVKILEGDPVHTTTAETQSSPKNNPINCERVMYTRLEQEKIARVERVESSDDSTSSSSDVASASPAAENGTTDPSWSSSSSSLAGYSNSILKEEQPCHSSSTSLVSHHGQQSPSSSHTVLNGPHLTNGHYSKSMLVSSFLDSRTKPEIVVTKDSPGTPKNGEVHSQSEDEVMDEDEATHCSVLSNGQDKSRSSGKSEFLRVESNDSTAENYGDDDDYNFDDEDEDLSHCSVATMNRYGTFESLEKIESEDTLGTLPEFTRNMPRSKARFTFDDDDDDDDDEDLFEEDFESDFNFKFPTQIQDNTYSVSRLGPLPPLLEEDYEDDMYEEHRETSPSNCNESRSHNQIHQAGVRGSDNSFLLARIATMYARSSISPLKIFRDLWLKKRYRQWAYKE